MGGFGPLGLRPNAVVFQAVRSQPVLRSVSVVEPEAGGTIIPRSQASSAAGQKEQIKMVAGPRNQRYLQPLPLAAGVLACERQQHSQSTHEPSVRQCSDHSAPSLPRQFQVAGPSTLLLNGAMIQTAFRAACT